MKSRRIIANPEQVSLDFTRQHEFTVRRSNRAKHLRINAHPDNGIEVVVPRRMSMKHVEPFVRQHQGWIEHQVIRLGLDQPVELPEAIHLRMIDAHWQVKYLAGQSRQYRLNENDKQLTITGPDKDTNACRDKLRQWLRKQAKVHLPRRLAVLAEHAGLKYQKLSIRTQRTRWGSCSSAGNINLNDRLLLLPAELTDYVMLHELCHTRHLNHSPLFWQLVKTHVPDYKAQEKQLKQTRQYLPAWL
jgi:predicted metal-dependent hydrolase